MGPRPPRSRPHSYIQPQPVAGNTNARPCRAGHSLRPGRGDSLRRTIDEGLSRSRFGIVVFSKSFFRKEWPQYELDGIVTRSLAGKQVILPIWHEVTEAEMIDRVPSLADKVARDTATWSIDEIAEEIADFVLSEQSAA